MALKRMIEASALVAGVGIVGLLGVGLGTADADPGPQQCAASWGPPSCPPAAPHQDAGAGRQQAGPPAAQPQNGPMADQWQQRGQTAAPEQWQWQRSNPEAGPEQWQPIPDGPRPDQWEQRGLDQGRWDHQPFAFQGPRVQPQFDNGRSQWGFWFFGTWIPL